MRPVDVIVPLVLILAAIIIVWTLVLISPVIFPFAIGLVALLVIFILTSFCSGRYTREGSSRPYSYKR